MVLLVYKWFESILYSLGRSYSENLSPSLWWCLCRRCECLRLLGIWTPTKTVCARWPTTQNDLKKIIYSFRQNHLTIQCLSVSFVCTFIVLFGISLVILYARIFGCFGIAIHFPRSNQWIWKININVKTLLSENDLWMVFQARMIRLFEVTSP